MGCSMEEGESGAEDDSQGSRAVTSLARCSVPWYPNKKSRAGPVSTTKVSHSPVISRQVCSDRAGPWPNQEANSSSWGEEKRGTTLGASIPVTKHRQGASSLIQVLSEEARPRSLTALLLQV